MEEIELPPDPAVLLRSLRGIGYSVEDAVADIADNSLSAGARNIEVWFADLGTDVCVDIVDDGDGLDEAMMKIALTLGARERDPSMARNSNDLGRFGLGLKTASFSVARRMTLFSRCGGWSGGWAWDLDEVQASGRWRIARLQSAERDELEKKLGARPSGTVVRWSKTDRLPFARNRSRTAELQRLSDRLRRHLGMVFHRFIEGVDSEGVEVPKLSIVFNGMAVRSWNPLSPLSHRPQLIDWSPEPRIAKGVRTEYAVLPPDVQMTADDRREACLEGRRLSDMQGFYVYRANRLVCYANWLGLPGDGQGRWNKEPSTQLARVAVDITNEADEEWCLDVRKSKVVPAERDRQVLIEMGGEAREKSRQRIFGRQTKVRKAPAVGDTLPALWLMDDRRLRVNREHPLVSAVTARKASETQELRSAVLSLLRHLEESPALISMVTEQSEATPEKTATPPVLDDTDFEDAVALGHCLRRGGTPMPTILEIIMTDPRYREDSALLERLRVRLEGAQ